MAECWRTVRRRGACSLWGRLSYVCPKGILSRVVGRGAVDLGRLCPKDVRFYLPHLALRLPLNEYFQHRTHRCSCTLEGAVHDALRWWYRLSLFIILSAAVAAGTWNCLPRNMLSSPLRPQPTKRTSWKLVANPGWQPGFPTSWQLVAN